MDWSEIFAWSQKAFIASCALVVQLTLSLMVGQEMHAAKMKASQKQPAASSVRTVDQSRPR